jgi:MFS family permease
MASPGKPQKKQVIGEKVSLRYAWYALFVLFLVNLINYIDRLSIGPAMEIIKRDFRVTDTQMGLVYSSFIFVYAVVSLPMGFLSDRGRRTRIIALGAFVWSLCTTASGFMHRFWAFFFMRAAVGSGEGIYAPSGTAIVSDYFPQRLRNTAIAIFMSAMIVGGAGAFIFAGMILDAKERFDMKKLKPLVVSEQVMRDSGWEFKNAGTVNKKHASFEFESGGSSLTVALKKFDGKEDKHEKSRSKGIDIYAESLLFDIYLVKHGKSTGLALTDGEKRLADAVAARIKAHEGDPIKESRGHLESLPHKFKIPKQYEDRFSYDKKSKELVWKGVMTKKDKLALLAISDSEHYSKVVTSMYSDTAYHYLKTDNWRWIFWILGPPGLLLALLAFLLKEPLKGGGEEFLSEEEARKAEEHGKVDYKLIFKTPSVMLLMISNILATYCVGGLVAWLFPYVERYKHIEAAEASMTFGPVVVGASVVGVIVSGILADRLMKITPRGNNIVLVLAILLGTPFLYLFLYEKHSMTMMLVYISCAMFFLTWLNGPLNALLMSLVEPRLRASVNAVHILLIHVLGDALSPIVIGHYSDVKSLEYALAITPLFLIAGMIGFGIAGVFVPKDLKAVELRMKAAGIVDDGKKPMGH